MDSEGFIKSSTNIVKLFNVIQMSTFCIELGYTLIVNFEIIPSALYIH